jgi:hypothetical protein
MQTGTYDDMVQLREYLGMSYPAILQSLNAKTRSFFATPTSSPPAQAAEMRAHMAASDTWPAASILYPRLLFRRTEVGLFGDTVMPPWHRSTR